MESATAPSAAAAASAPRSAAAAAADANVEARAAAASESFLSALHDALAEAEAEVVAAKVPIAGLGRVKGSFSKLRTILDERTGTLVNTALASLQDASNEALTAQRTELGALHDLALAAKEAELLSKREELVSSAEERRAAAEAAAAEAKGQYEALLNRRDHTTELVDKLAESEEKLEKAHAKIESIEAKLQAKEAKLKQVGEEWEHGLESALKKCTLRPLGTKEPGSSKLPGGAGSSSNSAEGGGVGSGSYGSRRKSMSLREPDDPAFGGSIKAPPQRTAGEQIKEAVGGIKGYGAKLAHIAAIYEERKLEVCARAYRVCVLTVCGRLRAYEPCVRAVSNAHADTGCSRLSDCRMCLLCVSQLAHQASNIRKAAEAEMNAAMEGVQASSSHRGRSRTMPAHSMHTRHSLCLIFSLGVFLWYTVCVRVCGA